MSTLMQDDRFDVFWENEEGQPFRARVVAFYAPATGASFAPMVVRGLGLCSAEDLIASVSGREGVMTARLVDRASNNEYTKAVRDRIGP